MRSLMLTTQYKKQPWITCPFNNAAVFIQTNQPSGQMNDHGGLMYPGVILFIVYLSYF